MTYSLMVLPGKTLGKNSIVVGADESGNISVTANGNAGTLLQKNDLIVGLDEETGQLYIITQGTVQTTVGKADIVAGLNKDEELEVPVKGTVGSTVDKPSIVIGTDENGNYSVTANGEVGTAIPRDGLLLNINKDGTYDIVANGTPGNTVSEDNIVLNRNEDGTYSVTVNGKAGDLINKGNIVLGLTEDSWSVTTNASAGTTVGKGDLVKGTTDGAYGVKVDADTKGALSKVEELQKAATEPAEKVVTVTVQPSHPEFEPSPTPDPGKKTTGSPTPTPTPTPAPGNSMTVPVNIDPAQLHQQIVNAGESVGNVNINVDANTTENQGKAAKLKDYIETMNPKITVTVTYDTTNKPYAKGTPYAKEGPAIVDDEKASKSKELIIHKDGTAELGTDNGPRLTYLQEGDQVLTARETERVLRQKGTELPRHASGTLPSPVGGGDSNRSSNSSSSKKATSINWKKYIDRLFDWVEIRLKRLQEITDKWSRQIERAVGAINKNKAIDSAIASISSQISALQEAASRYEEQAAAVAKKTKLSSGIIAAIQNGTMDITQYDSNTQTKIKEYMEWYEKAKAAREEIENLKDRQEELSHQNSIISSSNMMI